MSENNTPTITNEAFDMSRFDPRKIEWTHDIAREKLYADIKEQLDMLYKDIEAGVFGEKAKTGTWFQHIKEVKETHPVGSIHKPYADLPGPDGS
jgi:hypothetical protein